MMYVFKFVFLLITYFFVYLSVRKIINYNNKINLLSVLFILVVAFANFLTIQATNDVFKGIVSYSGLLLYSFEIRRKFRKEQIVDGFVSYIHIVVIDILLALMVSIVGFSNFITKCSNDSIYKLMYSSVYGLVLYLSLYIKVWHKFLNKIHKSLNNSKVFYITITIILLAVEITTIFTLMNNNNSKEVILSCILVGLFIIGLIYLQYSAIRKHDLKQQNEKLIIQSDSLYKILNNYKLFKHNINHELKLIESVGNSKVKSIIKDYLAEHSEIAPDNMKDLDKVPGSLKNIIYSKLLENIDLKYDVFIDNLLDNDPFENLSTHKMSVLYQCIGIALDNAIEATSEDKNGFVYIKFSSENDYIEIVLENKFHGNINVDELCNYGVTTKKNHMGVGTQYLVTQNVIKTEIKIRDDVFVVSLRIKK